MNVTDDRARTLAEIARALGLSRQRVMQLEQSALRKLRRALVRKGLRLEDFFQPRNER